MKIQNEHNWLFENISHITQFILFFNRQVQLVKKKVMLAYIKIFSYLEKNVCKV